MAKKQKNEKRTGQQNRKTWFKLFKKLLIGRYKEPKFIYLGEKLGNGGIVLSNHAGTDAPLSLELYVDAPLRMWGASEMNSGLIKMYKYQSRVYYHEKKHWNLFLARLFCLIASPLTNLFYKGLNLISTYRDARFAKTIRESIEAIKNGENIVIFPEDSKNGYLDQLEGFHPGFVMLAEVLKRKGVDVPIYVTYFNKEKLIYMIDKPVMFSELSKNGEKREEIAMRLAERCNELGRMTFDNTSKHEKKAETEIIEVTEAGTVIA